MKKHKFSIIDRVKQAMQYGIKGMIYGYNKVPDNIHTHNRYCEYLEKLSIITTNDITDKVKRGIITDTSVDTSYKVGNDVFSIKNIEEKLKNLPLENIRIVGDKYHV